MSELAARSSQCGRERVRYEGTYITLQDGKERRVGPARAQ